MGDGGIRDAKAGLLLELGDNGVPVPIAAGLSAGSDGDGVEATAGLGRGLLGARDLEVGIGDRELWRCGVAF